MGWAPTGLNEIERAIYELGKVVRKLDHCSVRRVYTPPVLDRSKIYRKPHGRYLKGIGSGYCEECMRPVMSWHGGAKCIECFQRDVRRKFFDKVWAEEQRVDLFNRVFNEVINRKEHQMSDNTSVARSTHGLRQALFDEMDALRNGTSNAQRARSMAMMANSILQSVQVEIEYHKYVKANGPHGDSKAVQLGTNIELVEEKKEAA